MKKFLAITGAALLASAPAFAQAAAPVPDTGNTAWLLICSALVMLMTPGLAFFYAGMVSRKNVVSTLLQNYAALAVIAILWVVIGYSLVFTSGSPLLGGTENFMLNGMLNTVNETTGIPNYAFMAFQMMFAIITPALMTGAIAERVNFKAWLLIMALWSLCVYVPVAHWVWGPDGWLLARGGLDFAGGLVVHITAGVGGLIAAVLFGKRIGAHEESPPNDISMIMIGAALLWFGWFGFNAGSALTSGALAAHAFVTTHIGASAALISWVLVDWMLHKKPSAVGASIGLVVGLVTITPAAGFVTVQSAIIMCLIAGAACNLFARFLKKKLMLDDTLDVFACHGMGGIIGAILTGVFASKDVNSAVTVQGLLVSGETSLFMTNLIGVVAVFAYTAVVTFVLIKIVGFITPVRVAEHHEMEGLDKSVHGEVSRFHKRA